jgi:dTDP-glucose pyrophosphorylase
MVDHLKTSNEYSMAGFLLENTVTENGTVARGVCQTADDYLSEIVEHLAIPKNNDFPAGTVVSMNMWGLQTNVFDYLREQFAEFMALRGHEEKSEFLIPTVIDNIIQSGKEKVKVLKTADKWYGVTYREDLDGVVAAVRELVESGRYQGM